MLKICALILTLPLSVWASNDCQVSQTESATSIQCADLVMTKKLKPQNDEIHLEFVDGFTLFFQARENQQPEEFVLALGDRDEAMISSFEKNRVASALQLLSENDDNSEEITKFLNSLPSNVSLRENIQFGGEVPWPIIDCDEKANKRSKSCKEKK